MKRTLAVLILLILLILLAGSPANAGWFNSKEEKLLAQTQQQLEHARQQTGAWQLVSGVLALGCVSLLVFGTALGSKVRMAWRKEEVITPVFHENSPTGEP